MSLPGVDVGTCLLALWQGSVSADAIGWSESITLEVGYAEDCTEITLTESDHVTLTAIGGHLRIADGPKIKLDSARVQRHPTRDDGSTRWSVLIPDMAQGDTVTVHVQRAWTSPEDFRWTPGEAEAQYAELKLPRGRTPTLRGFRQDGRFVWAKAPTREQHVILPHAWADRAESIAPPMARDDLSAEAAAARLDALLWLPRAADGDSPRIGEEALARGAVDDRGYARTLVGSTRTGPDRVLLGRWVPLADAEPTSKALEFAVWQSPDGLVALTHPRYAWPEGYIQTSAGVLETPGHQPTAADPEIKPHITTRLTVALQPGDPRRQVHPSAGALVDVRQTVSWATDDTAHMLFVPLPDEASATAVTPSAGTTRIRANRGVWVVAPPGAPSATVSWTQPLRDVWGMVPTGTDELELHGGFVRGAFEPGKASEQVSGSAEILSDDDGTWRIQTFDGVPFVTDRRRLAKELHARRIASSYPEPGLPQKLRGLARDWSLAELLPAALHERAVPAALHVDAWWPRGLQQARRGRAMTEAEFTTTVARYAQQAHLFAEVVLVSPLGAPLASTMTPAGFDHALLRLEYEGEVRWMDPACAVCAPWEIRPELVGVPTLPTVDAPAVWLQDGLPGGLVKTETHWAWNTETQVPLHGVGAWQITETAEESRWNLAGAEALALRRWLHETVATRRTRAMTNLLGSRPLDLQGLADAGAPIQFRVESPRSPIDPLALAAWGTWASDDALMLPHLGIREWTRPWQGKPTTASCDDSSWSYYAEVRDNQLTESLVVRERMLQAESLDALQHCRGEMFRRTSSPETRDGPEDQPQEPEDG